MSGFFGVSRGFGGGLKKVFLGTSFFFVIYFTLSMLALRSPLSLQFVSVFAVVVVYIAPVWIGSFLMRRIPNWKIMDTALSSMVFSLISEALIWESLIIDNKDESFSFPVLKFATGVAILTALACLGSYAAYRGKLRARIEE